MIRIVVADDHAVVRAGISSWLDEESDMSVIGQARNGKDALALIKHEMPDVLFSDIEMPDMKGTELAEKAREIHPDIKIVLMTVHKGWYLQKILAQGNMGYITKEADREAFALAVRWAMQGRHWIDPDELHEDLSRERTIQSLGFTPKERVILSHLHLSNKEIADVVCISEKTLMKSHLPNIYFKLQVKHRQDAVDWARKMRIIERESL